ncbi:MAG: hypothetical protein KDJ65_39950, partial [Anaerolineae bacterium]|nr:hypothetical protein [Anaerolineae bacterium]
IITGDTTTGLGDNALAALFATIAHQIAANPHLDETDKQDVAADVNDLQSTLTAPADAPAAQETFWQRRLRNIERMAPDIIDTIATTTANPATGLKAVWAKIVAKAREMQAGR